MTRQHHDDYDPTGYYTRKNERNNEFLDKALIPFFKGYLQSSGKIYIYTLAKVQ